MPYEAMCIPVYARILDCSTHYRVLAVCRETLIASTSGLLQPILLAVTTMRDSLVRAASYFEGTCVTWSTYCTVRYITETSDITATVSSFTLDTQRERTKKFPGQLL